MDKDKMLRLDNQLCFLIYAGSRAMTRMYKSLLDKIGVTYPQYLVLLVLWEEKKASVKKLGNRLHLDSGTLTPLLKRMESAGILSRERSVDDERKVYIRLTEKGEKLKSKAYDVPEQMMCRSGLTIEQYLQLKSGLEALLHNINGIDASKP